MLELMLTAGIGVKCEDTTDVKSDASLTYYNLPSGQQKLALMSADSPALFYLFSMETLNNFQFTIQPAIDNAASGQAVLLDSSPVEGMRLLASEEDTWYKAVAKKVVDNKNVMIWAVLPPCRWTS